VSELRIGVVAYSNTAPLTAGLPAGGMRRGLPCEVADWLAAGEVDVGLIPAIELARAPGVRGLPGWGIAADGPCLSVLLFGKVPLADVRSLTLDAASRTAAALTRVLLDREGCRDVRFVPMAGGTVAERLDGVDATLVIGDPALQAEVPGGVSRWSEPLGARRLL
jgi:chorismate dehydratase